MKSGLCLFLALACVTALADGLAEHGAALYARHQYAAALPLLTRSAQAGNPTAQVMLGIMYRNGDGARANDRTAAHWFQLAAAQGNRAAQYELGTLYEDGRGGLPKDDRTAIQQYIRSASQGFESAALILGLDYELGDGIPRSRATAIGFLQQAGEQGLFLANVLQRPGTPARFDGAGALGNYLAQVPDSPTAEVWKDAAAPRRAGEALTLAGALQSKRHAYNKT